MKIARALFSVFALLLLTSVITQDVARAQVGQLLINKAIYGKEGQGKDVTVRLRRMIQNNTLNIKVTNENMGGDPNKGADKSVKVDYTFRGKRMQKVVNEGGRLQLP